NWSAAAAGVVPAAVVTWMSTLPTFDDRGEMAVICLSVSTVKLLAGTLPKATEVPEKSCPLIVTLVPPDTDPEFRLMELIPAGGCTSALKRSSRLWVVLVGALVEPSPRGGNHWENADPLTLALSRWLPLSRSMPTRSPAWIGKLVGISIVAVPLAEGGPLVASPVYCPPPTRRRTRSLNLPA